ARSRIDRPRGGDKCAMGLAGDLSCGALDVGECREGQRRSRDVVHRWDDLNIYFKFPESSSYTFRTAIGAWDPASVHEAYSPKFACFTASSTGTPALYSRVASAMTAW